MQFSEQEQKRCPYLSKEKVKICEAQSEGLKVPSKKEVYEYCEGQFHLCLTYQKVCKSTAKLKEGR